MDSPELVDHSQAVALSFVEAFTLRRADLDDVLQSFPKARERVTREARRVVIARSLLTYLCKQMGKDGPNSFALRSVSRGHVQIQQPPPNNVQKQVLAMDNKIDSIAAEVTELKGLITAVLGKLR